MSQKVLLVNLPPALNYDFSGAGGVYPATGILLIGSLMKSRGLTVRLIDGALYPDYERRILAAIDRETTMVCFSVMTSQVPMALRVSKKIKEKNKQVTVVWGGMHAILFPEQTIRDPSVDVVAVGDGIATTLDLVDYLRGQLALDRIRGAGVKNDLGEVLINSQGEQDDIGQLPFIDFSILEDPERYLSAKSVYARELSTDNGEKVRLMPVLTALGCCFKCRFCINSILKRNYRSKSARSIIDEIKRLQARYGANAFLFLDEDFLINKKRLLEFLGLIEEEKLKFYWRIWGRVSFFNENYVNRDLLLRMERNGLRSIAMGAESGSQKILDLIQKQIKIEDILRSVEYLKGTGITARYSFIVGLEGETREDTRATYALCARLIDINPKVDIAGPFVFRFYPGSPLFDGIVKKYNIELPQKLEDWKDYLSDEGFLKIKDMPWLWPGLEKTVDQVNKYIEIYVHLNRARIFAGNPLKAIISWRIRNMRVGFPLEAMIYDLLFYFRGFIKKARYLWKK